MPVHTNSIGAYSFLDIEGAPILRQQQLEIIERAGVTGSGVRRLGSRGKVFELVTTNYVASFTTAKTNMDLYKAMVGTNPVTLIRQSVNEGTFIVMAVKERDRYAIFNAIGGFSGGEQCCQHVIWSLLG